MGAYLGPLNIQGGFRSKKIKTLGKMATLITTRNTPAFLEVYVRTSGPCTASLLTDFCVLSSTLMPSENFPKVYYLGEDTDDILCVEFVPGFAQLNFYILDDAQGNLLKAPEKDGWRLVICDNIHG